MSEESSERLRSQQSESIFIKSGNGQDGDGVERFTPTGLSRGPWHKGSQHGGAMLGLLARAVERHPADRPVQVTRLTVDMMRAAPLDEVETRCRTIRAGKQVEVVEATLTSGGEVYARASAMRFRVTQIEVEPNQDLGAPPAMPSSGHRPIWSADAEEAFHHAQEMRPATGLELSGLWLRLTVPFVAGEETSPLVRVAAAADSTYSVPFIARVMADPKMLRRGRSISINPDTTINIHRPLRGDWVCLQGFSHLDESGAGTAFARMFDQEGAIGHASQSILVRGTEARPESWGEFDKMLEKRR